MLKLEVKKHILQFKSPAGTSRGILYTKPSWFIILKDTENPNRVGFGECSIIPGLSIDQTEHFGNDLSSFLQKTYTVIALKEQIDDLDEWPALQFALEMALQDLFTETKLVLFPSDFSNGKSSIPINGLIWMGEKRSMHKQIRDKIEDGWDCIKLKIGAIDFEDELSLIKSIRSEFNENEITIRVDANGAFHPDNAIVKMDQLADLKIHSIEQPIKAGQPESMAKICECSPLPVALDEELIGIRGKDQKKILLDSIKPAYIILKPSLIGGFSSANEWIDTASSLGIKYWSTSALESNIGLNAIAQWASTLNLDIAQGLGTGTLFTNNIDSPLEISSGMLCMNQEKPWNLELFGL